MHLARTRSLFFLAFFACVSIVGAALYLEHRVVFAPCPLCLVQRVLFGLFAAVCLVAAAHCPQRRGWRLYSAALVVVSLAGVATAARQVWLQASPPEDIASCLGNLQNMLDTMPFLKVISEILAGHADCSEITWSLFGISIPEWSLLAFSGLSLFALYYLLIEFRRSGTPQNATPD
nr:disulfide bond formation protein B [Pseudomonas abietaniphila]